MKSETLNKGDAALRRLEEETYGNCFECGDESPRPAAGPAFCGSLDKDCEEARETAEQRER